MKGMDMKKLAVVWVVMSFFVGNVWAEEGVVDRAGNGIKKGGHAAARGIDKGSKATVKGVKKGGKWVGRGLKKAGDKVDKVAK
jgi:hypothetical protein